MSIIRPSYNSAENMCNHLQIVAARNLMLSLIHGKPWPQMNQVRGLVDNARKTSNTSLVKKKSANPDSQQKRLKRAHGFKLFLLAYPVQLVPKYIWH